MHLGIRRGGRRRARGEVPRDFRGLEKLPHLVPQGITHDEEPDREVREEASITKSLDTREGR